MRKTIAALTLAFSAILSCQNTFATTVLPSGTLTDLGIFDAGSYTITGSGSVDLLGNNTFQMQPNGLPVTSVTSSSYSYFNPGGSFIADGQLGIAGQNAKIGSLIGTLTANPINAADWFLIGYQTVLTLDARMHIYASVNDTYYPNNTGFFNATVSSVPAPASTWLFVGGMAILGFFNYRKMA